MPSEKIKNITKKPSTEEDNQGLYVKLTNASVAGLGLSCTSNSLDYLCIRPLGKLQSRASRKKEGRKVQLELLIFEI